MTQRDQTHINMGRLIVVSAPSGGGKTTLLRRLIEVDSICFLSVSHTTRPPRKGERDGEDYFFVSREEFDELISQNAFLEWAEVHGNRYGTTKASVADRLSEGRDVILEIDVLGHSQVKRSFASSISIFVVPPSLEELRRRLTNRGKDSEETIHLRLQNARQEMTQISQYDYLVINQHLKKCFDDLWSIIKAQRCRMEKMKAQIAEQVEKFCI